ncbi:MAG TPA: hypothetical protein VFZ59_04970 [Verrucomicrobiae bacterium]|nr:hypothetical protein [Verrucomicrobiae bacterium]
MRKVTVRTLRLVALIGLAIVLLVDLISSLRVTGGLGLGIVLLIVMALAVGLTALVLMPEAAGALLRNKDLLLPFALTLVVGKLLEWISAAQFLGTTLKSSLPLRFISVSFPISLMFVLHIALAIAYATWMTAALLDFVRTGNSDPVRALSEVPKRFSRIMGLEFIGWVIVMVVTSMLLQLMPLMGGWALLPMAAFGVMWNFATAAVLPAGFAMEGGFWRSFRAGVGASLGYLSKWWLLLLVQMALLGLVFYYQSSSGGNTNVSWSVNVFWTGGYEDECRWYGKLAEVMHAPKLPLANTLLTLLFGGFAIAIKLAIVQRLQPTAPSPELTNS